jgi:AAA ATPase-like protein
LTASLIGRDHHVAQLRAQLDRAVHSHGGLVLVTGEPGIGKTTLVTDAMAYAREAGALVLTGTCWDSGAAPGYWPWLQVLRALRRQLSADDWAEVAAAGGEPLALLLGESGDGRIADDFQLYDAVAGVLASTAATTPVLVVLDDLHWADPASVRLLEFVARHTWFEHLLVVGTYRDVEVEAVDHPLAPLLIPLQAGATTLTLTGLSPAEVGALISRTTGAEPDAARVADVHRRTGGNPFFVEQTARLWHDGAAVPPGVRDAVRRRVEQLPAAVTRLLTDAAVLGAEFHRQVLAAVVEQPVAQVDRWLGQANAVRLVTAVGDGRFRFAHDLVRESLYESLTDERARERHAAVVLAHARTPALADRIFPADLARHARLAGADVPADRALDLYEAAGRDARRHAAFEEAAGHYKRAVDVADTLDDPVRRVRVGIDYGNVLDHSDQRAAAWTEFERCAEIALELADAEPLARLALNVYSYAERTERARLPERLVRAAYRRYFGDPGERPLDGLARELTTHLIAHARTDGDDETLGFTLWALHDLLWGTGTAAERLRITEELVEVAQRSDDAEMEQFAVSLGWVAALELGDPGFLDRLARFVALVERNPQPMTVPGAVIDRMIIAAFQGRFADADAAYAELAEISHPHSDSIGFGYMLHHARWARMLLQGKYAELGDVRAAASAVQHPFPALLAGITAAERGDPALALRCVEELSVGEPMPASFRPMWLRLRAQAAEATADRAECARVRELLVPVSGQWLVSAYGFDIAGMAGYWLGRLDIVLGRWDDAVAELTAARDSADVLGARPWAVDAALALATALDGRGDPEAATVRAAASAEAERLGLHRRTSTVDSPDPVGKPEFRFTGEVWSLSMDGHTVHLPDAKGLRDLHTLLSAPNVAIPAVRLLDPAGGAEVVAARGLGGDDVLDDEAKAAYRRRLTQLDEQIDLATSRGEDTRAASLDEERAALLAELRAATGLGGRTRRLGDEAERARKAVTARIRDTLRKLAPRHPTLATHLNATITTGTHCTYHPPHPTPWHL